MLSSLSDRNGSGHAFPPLLLVVFTFVAIFMTLRQQDQAAFDGGNATESSITHEESSSSRLPTPLAFSDGEQPPWIILLTVNNGFFDFFQNWMAHYNLLDITRDDVGIVIVAYDDVVLEKIQYYNGSLPPRTIVVPSEATVHTANSTDFTYGTYEFKKLMANRANIILGQLHKGSSVLLVDLDIVLLKDPFPYLIDPVDNQEYDMLIQYDRDWQHSPKAARQAHRDTYCAGLFAAANNPKVVSFMKAWQTELLKAPTMNQRIFNQLLSENTQNISYSGLDTKLFMSGHFYWDVYADQPEILREAVAVHGNFITGHDPKKQRFIDSGMWLV